MITMELKLLLAMDATYTNRPISPGELCIILEDAGFSVESGEKVLIVRRLPPV